MTQFTLHTLDLPAFQRHAIGFDRLFDELNRNFASAKTDTNYPPYNIVKLDDTHWIVEVAVAGFAETELDISLEGRVLKVTGEKGTQPDTTTEYLHRGISARNWERTFTMSEHMEVLAATVKNGILAIALEHVIPEEKKPKKIAITFQG